MADLIAAVGARPDLAWSALCALVLAGYAVVLGWNGTLRATGRMILTSTDTTGSVGGTYFDEGE